MNILFIELIKMKVKVKDYCLWRLAVNVNRTEDIINYIHDNFDWEIIVDFKWIEVTIFAFLRPILWFLETYYKWKYKIINKSKIVENDILILLNKEIWK